MVKKLLLPQEIETFYIIPALRKYFAIFMKEAGMKQKDIADILMINTAAISQYTSSKRGGKVEFKTDIITEIKLSAARITDRTSYMKETQRLLHHIRMTNTLCDIHRQFSAVPTHCEPKDMGCHTKTYSV
ncbi:TPA: hypothetical protein HA241_00845 [Candidatus Woesearchaeota archaeon]|nr:hypothetical protein [Candidatus Woesearchaeota archaeon]